MCAAPSCIICVAAAASRRASPNGPAQRRRSLRRTRRGGVTIRPNCHGPVSPQPIAPVALPRVQAAPIPDHDHPSRTLGDGPQAGRGACPGEADLRRRSTVRCWTLFSLHVQAEKGLSACSIARLMRWRHSARRDHALEHHDRRGNKCADRGTVGALRQQPEVEGAGGGWRVEPLSPSVGSGRRRPRRSGRWWEVRTLLADQENARPGHRGGRWSRGQVYPAVRSNARVVNLRSGGRPIGRHDGCAPGRAGSRRGPRARACCGIGGLDFDVDCRRPAQTGERVRAGNTCDRRPCSRASGAGAQVVTGCGAVGAVDRRCGPSDRELGWWYRSAAARRWRWPGRSVRRAPLLLLW